MLPSFETFFASFSDFILRLFASDWHPRPSGARANFLGGGPAGGGEEEGGSPRVLCLCRERSEGEEEGSKAEVKEFVYVQGFRVK